MVIRRNVWQLYFPRNFGGGFLCACVHFLGGGAKACSVCIGPVGGRMAFVELGSIFYGIAVATGEGDGCQEGGGRIRFWCWWLI